MPGSHACHTTSSPWRRVALATCTAAVSVAILLVIVLNILLGIVFGVAFTVFVIRITSAMFAVALPSAASGIFST